MLPLLSVLAMTIGDRLRQVRQDRGLSQTALARLAGVSQGLIAQIEKGTNQGTKHVTSLARALGVAAAWLADGEGEPPEAGPRIDGFPPVPDDRGVVTIRQYDTGGKMGSGGVELRDQPGVIESWRVSRDWVEQNVRGYASVDKLCLVTGFGDSMKPMFNPGDPLIVDASVKTVEFDAVYFFRVDNEGFIKRLQRVPGKGLLAISENRAYRDWVIDKTMDFEVFGRVLKVWRSEEF